MSFIFMMKQFLSFKGKQDGQTTVIPARAGGKLEDFNLVVETLKTKDPIHVNFKADADEMKIRLAVHFLSDALDDTLTILQDEEVGVYLVGSILAGDSDDSESEEPRPAGTVEYQVSDGPPGERGHSNDFYNFKEAHAFYKDVIKAGGFKHFYAQADDSATASKEPDDPSLDIEQPNGNTPREEAEKDFSATVKALIPSYREAEVTVKATSESEAKEKIKEMYEEDELDFGDAENDYDEAKIVSIKFNK